MLQNKKKTQIFLKQMCISPSRDNLNTVVPSDFSWDPFLLKPHIISGNRVSAYLGRLFTYIYKGLFKMM